MAKHQIFLGAAFRPSMLGNCQCYCFNGTLLVWSVAGTCFPRDGLNGAYNSVSNGRGYLISLNAFSGRISWISLQGYLDCGGWPGWEFVEVVANPIPLWLVKFFHLKHSVWCLP